MKRSFRRWLLWGTLICIATFVSMLAWLLYRPLNDIEKQLVGAWRNTSVTGAGIFILNPDRTISMPQIKNTGDFWSVEGTTLNDSDGLAKDMARDLSEMV